jgi:hypothetical protein
MVKKFNQYLKEEYLDGQFKDQSGSDYKVYQLLYYAFDWDDNILHMPTEIFLLNDKGEEVGMSTQDFAKYRSLIGIEDFDYNQNIIVGFANDSFRYFRDQVDPNIFVKDVQKALDNDMRAKSYNKFIKCLTTGSLFAIITARGHEPETMRRGIEEVIKRFSSTERTSMLDHLKLFAHLFNKKITSDEELISNYLDLCEYIGVSAPSRGGKPDNPEKAKEDSFLEFVDKCNSFAKELEDDFNDRGENWRVIAKIGFSDDDPGNVKHMDDVLKELHNETYSNVKEFYLFDTGGEDTQKTVFPKYDTPLVKTEESIVKNFKDFVLETSHQTPGLESSVMKSTQFGNMAGQLNPSSPINRQDDFYNQFRRQVDYLAKNKEITKDMKKRKKSSK